MSLAHLFSKDVGMGVQERGLHYFRRGRVKIADSSPKMLLAQVQGTSRYSVDIKVHDDEVRATCTCGYFTEHDRICKHIWATILKADEQLYLEDARASTPMRLIPFIDEDAVPTQSARRKPARQPRRGRSKSGPLQRRLPEWKRHLDAMLHTINAYEQHREKWPAGRELYYAINPQATLNSKSGIVVHLLHRERRATGEWGKLKPQGLSRKLVMSIPSAEDQEIVALLFGSQKNSYYSNAYSYSEQAGTFTLDSPVQRAMLPAMCKTGRCILQPASEEQQIVPLQWQSAGWEFCLNVRKDLSGKTFVLDGYFVRDSERMRVKEPVVCTRNGVLIYGNWIAPLSDTGAFEWISFLRHEDEIRVPDADAEELLEKIMSYPSLPKLDLPPELRFEKIDCKPRPCFKVRKPDDWNDNLRGELLFDYAGTIVPFDAALAGVFEKSARRMICRDRVAEEAARETLLQLGVRNARHLYPSESHPLEISQRNLSRIVAILLRADWRVEAEGKRFSKPGEFKVEVSSGMDWFDVNATVEYGTTKASLPKLLAALRRGEETILLDDGSYGLLPEEWLKKFGTLAGLGQTQDGAIRFGKSQAGLLDALLSTQPETVYDEAFKRIREELRTFQAVEPSDPPKTFSGTLRAYQREALGWFDFLRRFGFGGCLADDMGLGKTVQVLALLESRRVAEKAASGKRAPSLVVVPRSLVFNWKQEAARFTPMLRVLEHSGAARIKGNEHFGEYDLILTTYGTLRNDTLHFKDVQFDYVILDEAQAVKNAGTESAKAVRVLRGNHRLALSGTPVENHLGELWSLFEFINPGMLGSAAVFNSCGIGGRDVPAETRAILARALRPFILRRTKDQVARDLPEKLEQTLYCELEPEQRKHYDELRAHYRNSLLGKIEKDGINKSKIQILEALLRLRQAACHPGLIDKERVDEPSAKLDFLLPQLMEVLDEGHKVLVFSQFTSMLAILRKRLDAENVAYEYLDGKTRDRQQRVEHFQNDPSCKLFLISLKAGGLGLNLTAAEYVYLLDPWWNPAVEAQAIDRAHRIGQSRRVFAYRLIARDTVEEKVLALQQSKRDLADAIINADNSLIRTLERKDLELLLS